VENSLDFNVADTKNSYFIVKIPVVLLFTFHREYCISHRGNDNHAEKFLMMGHSRYSHVFNFAILLKSQPTANHVAHSVCHTLSVTWLDCATKVDKPIEMSFGG